MGRRYDICDRCKNLIHRLTATCPQALISFVFAYLYLGDKLGIRGLASLLPELVDIPFSLVQFNRVVVHLDLAEINKLWSNRRGGCLVAKLVERYLVDGKREHGNFWNVAY